MTFFPDRTQKKLLMFTPKLPTAALIENDLSVGKLNVKSVKKCHCLCQDAQSDLL